MSVLRLFAIVMIFAAVTIAWFILGGTIEYRTAELGKSLAQEVDSMWGPSGLEQSAPTVISGPQSQPDAQSQISSSAISADFDHHNRYRGLLWFSTYTVRFTGTYGVTVSASGANDPARYFMLPLPCYARAFEGLAVALDGKPCSASVVDNRGNGYIKLLLPAEGGEHQVSVSYQTRGRDRWLYVPGPGGLMRNFTLAASANFADIDYPKGSVSPIQPASIDNGTARAAWRYDNVLMTQPMGIEMPRHPDAGPIAARMAFFAPVSLFFFFTALFTLVVLKKLPLHPMHYLFISAGFFSFNILMAYLVDMVNIHVTFWICAAVSVLLVVSYMRLVAGIRFAMVYVGLAQMVYLVMFSYAFFWAGKTGLVVTIGAIATLFVLMQATGRVNWHEVFRRPSPPMPPPVILQPLPEQPRPPQAGF